MRQNSDDGKDGGLTRSSDEAFVMKVERRGQLIQQVILNN